MPFVNDGFAKQDPSKNLSADEIAFLLGYADAATLTAAIDAGAEQAVGTSDSPQFAGINLGHASDTTLTRVSAGVVAVEGVNVVLANVLTANGDLLTRTAGVPARLGLGTALQVLRTNAGATALEYATLSSGGFDQQIARFSRITSAQSSLSGSYAANTVAYNSEELDEGGVWSNSGGTLTLASGGDGDYDIVVNYHYTGAEGVFILSVNGAGRGWAWYTGAGSGMAGVIFVPGVALVATDTVKVEFFSSAAAGNISYQYTGLATTLTGGRTNRITLIRRA